VRASRSHAPAWECLRGRSCVPGFRQRSTQERRGLPSHAGAWETPRKSAEPLRGDRLSLPRSAWECLRERSSVPVFGSARRRSVAGCIPTLERGNEVATGVRHGDVAFAAQLLGHLACCANKKGSPLAPFPLRHVYVPYCQNRPRINSAVATNEVCPFELGSRNSGRMVGMENWTLPFSTSAKDRVTLMVP